PAARRAHATLVEIVRDLPRGLARDVVSEDLTNDLGFFLDYLQLPRPAGHRTITERASASVPPVADHSLQAASRVQHKVLDKHLAHERPQRAVELSDLSAGSIGSRRRDDRGACGWCGSRLGREKADPCPRLR